VKNYPEVRQPLTSSLLPHYNYSSIQHLFYFDKYFFIYFIIFIFDITTEIFKYFLINLKGEERPLPLNNKSFYYDKYYQLTFKNIY